MMLRTGITLEAETRRRARQRATEMGISLPEYIRRLITRDLGTSQTAADVSIAFDLGSSGGSDVAKNKDAMLAQAFVSGRTKPRRR
ncbi:MAG: hypothetical protein C5B51_28715 [Terriglobia bacterium]|nr:MAG: hypothetical protein C5B51_28715 [Terriglobia bacterium]